MSETTRETQYTICLELAREQGFQRFGLMSNYAWHKDPKRLAFTLSRYKFVAKMLSGQQRVLELGCADGFGTRVVRQDVGYLKAVDFDPIFIADARAYVSDKWPVDFEVHDITAGPLLNEYFDAIYCLDVFEHIDPALEDTFIENIQLMLGSDGVVIIGIPSLASQAHAAPDSKEGHVNCKDGVELKSFLERHFANVFVFSMNDEVVHTGYYPMAHYLLAVCCGARR